MSALITLILNGLSSLLNHLTRSPDEIAAYDPTTEMNVAESSVKDGRWMYYSTDRDYAEDTE